MKKIWYLDIRGHLEGPYSIRDLRRDSRVTPDTLVWREGFAHSVPIRNVPELKAVFSDEEKPREKGDLKTGIKRLNDTMILEMSQEPPFLMWVVVLLVLFLLGWYLHWQ
jgi:hypothetical protein